MYIHTHVRTDTHTYMYIHADTCTYICTYIHTDICTYIHMYVQTHPPPIKSCSTSLFTHRSGYCTLGGGREHSTHSLLCFHCAQLLSSQCH
ncbi:unnamed protein product [Staurois parvus]|uniref:Uncharacterized protein n=1 Tax=Staurois parvus TaxID=386267 RepID=A0ABN9BS36_9NEOB|nr:unnamed protein product [Staurois parvus]